MQIHLVRYCNINHPHLILFPTVKKRGYPPGLPPSYQTLHLSYDKVLSLYSNDFPLVIDKQPARIFRSRHGPEG